MLTHKDLPIKGEINGFEYFYYYDYIPLRFPTTDELDMKRKFIHDFRNGLIDPEVISEKLTSDFGSLQLTSPISDWWLCVVPALNQEMTDRRFKLCSDLVCGKSAINNGYSLIRNLPYFELSVYQIDRRVADMREHLIFDRFKGKRVLIFDDVLNTGNIFTTIANVLINQGVIEVKGVFIGKVTWDEKT